MKRRARGLLAATGTLALVAAGCGGGAKQADTGSSGGGGAPDATPKLVASTPPATKPVDLVKWALPAGEPTTIDPAKAGGDSEQTVVPNLCESVVRLQPDFSVAPGLAKSADWRNPTTFVIDLRPDVTFWDGKPMTADDVVYSMQRNLDPNVQGIYGGIYAFVKDIRKTGPLQVTLTFKQHDAEFGYALAGLGGVVVEKAYAEQQGKAFGTPSGGLMCTGPYRLGKWAPGESITIDRNDHYWDGAPRTGEIEFRFISDTSTLTSALLAGEVDGAFEVPVGSASAFTSSGQGKLWVGPSTVFIGFGPASSTGPAADPRVRQALQLAIDKDAYIKSVLGGYGEPLKTFTVPLVWENIPGNATYRSAYDKLAGFDQDLEKAKALIAQAKPGKQTLTFAVPAGNQTLLQTATIAQAAAKQLGFDAKINQLQPTQFSAFFYDPSARAGTDFVVTTGWIDVPGALYYAPQFATKGGLFNWTGYDNPQVAKLLGQAQTATDPEQTARLFAQAQAIFAPDLLQNDLAIPYMLTFLSKRLTGVTTSSAFFNSPWAAKLGGA